MPWEFRSAPDAMTSTSRTQKTQCLAPGQRALTHRCWEIGTMSPRLPTIEQVLDIAEFYGMHLTAEDAASFRGLMVGPIASYARLDQLAEPKLPVKFPRDPGYRPGPDE